MHEAIPSKAERFEQVRKQLERNAHFYSEIDSSNIILSSFASATLEALESNEKGGVREVIDYLLDMRTDIDGPHAVKLLERGYQADLLQHDESYPRGYERQAVWHEAFAQIDIDIDFMRWGILANNITLRPVQSNVAERYKAVKIISALTAERFDDSISILDIGSSVLHGGLKLLYENMPTSGVLPFKSMEVLSSAESKQRDDRITTLANIALRESVAFGPVMGNDLTDIDDPSVRRWAKSCRFYPNELLKKKAVAEYDALDSLDPSHEKVHFFQGDFANLDRKRFAEVSPVAQWDIITFSTVFYQVSKQEQLAMLINASSLLSENGIIIIQDAPDGNFSKNFNYVTSVIDALAPQNNREKPLLVWENGRCRKAVTGMGKLSVQGQLMTFEDALEARYGAAT